MKSLTVAGTAYAQRVRVSLCITEIREGDATALKVEGRLDAQNVATLEASVRGVRGETILDFSHLYGIDDAGLRAILRLINGGSPVVAASPYLRLRLERGSESAAGGEQGGRRA